ncbi:MAG: hypothetical protein ACRCZF_19995, partial [Gemmataceae bacterium]
GLTNLNEEGSAQLCIEPDDTEIVSGKKYMLRIEYRTMNDGEGVLSVRLPEDNFANCGSTKLNSTTGEWKLAEVAFVRPDAKIDAAVDNNSIGEGNTIFVRKIEFVSAQ